MAKWYKGISLCCRCGVLIRHLMYDNRDMGRGHTPILTHANTHTHTHTHAYTDTRTNTHTHLHIHTVRHTGRHTSREAVVYL